MTQIQYSPGFLKFWKCYPARRVNKPGCHRKWVQHGLEARTDEIIALLARYCESDQWRDLGGQYVPNSYKWLGGQPWEGGDIPPATKLREAEHRERIMAERRQARQNPIAVEIGEAKAVEDEWAELERKVAEAFPSPSQQRAERARQEAKAGMPLPNKLWKMQWAKGLK